MLGICFHQEKAWSNEPTRTRKIRGETEENRRQPSEEAQRGILQLHQLPLFPLSVDVERQCADSAFPLGVISVGLFVCGAVHWCSHQVAVRKDV